MEFDLSQTCFHSNTSCCKSHTSQIYNRLRFGTVKSFLGTVMFINSQICHRTALSRDHLQILSLRNPRSIVCCRCLIKKIKNKEEVLTAAVMVRPQIAHLIIMKRLIRSPDHFRFRALMLNAGFWASINYSLFPNDICWNVPPNPLVYLPLCIFIHLHRGLTEGIPCDLWKYRAKIVSPAVGSQKSRCMYLINGLSHIAAPRAVGWCCGAGQLPLPQTAGVLLSPPSWPPSSHLSQSFHFHPALHRCWCVLQYSSY